ncbi:MAG: glycosyltransferase family 39 protein [Fimbriimonadaceae bacterium]|nr:glycosyltransferase family 39 protein [Fimbriimonadaceae bacterium]
MPGPLLLLSLLFVLAAGGYWALVPHGYGPDEESHLLFIQTLSGEQTASAGWAWGLPLLQTSGDDPNFEVHQPPLYYVLATVAWRLGGLPAVRLLNLLGGLALVWVTWALVRAVAGEDLAVAAAAVVALLPMNVFLASRVNNDPLANLCWALLLWRWVLSLRDGPSRRAGLWAGLALGAALLTKASSVALLPLVLLTALLSGLPRRNWRLAGEQAAITLAVAGLLAGWWYLRNQVVYGDLLAQQAFQERFLTTRMTRARLLAEFAARGQHLAYWPYVAEWISRSAVIYVGHDLVRLPLGVAPLHNGLLLAALLASAGGWGWRVRTRGWDPGSAAALLLAAAALLTVLLLWQFNTVYFQAQGRYLFLALPAWALALTAGPSRLWRRGAAGWRWGLALLPLWLGLLQLLILGVFLPGLFDTPAR